MDVKQFADQLKNRMVDQIEAIKLTETDVLTAWAKITNITKEINHELKQFLRDQIIEDQGDAIQLNKEIRPYFLCRHFFHLKVFELELKASIFDPDEALKLYKNQLQQILNFQVRHKVFYSYVKSGATHHDEQYFLNLSSNCRRLAVVFAYDELKKHILNKMISSSKAVSNYAPNLSWTGSKTDLVELIYALQANKCIDHGKIHLSTLVPVFEKIFNTSLGNYYRTFLEISIRKTGRTKFLDSLQESLNRRLVEADGKW
jgi:hypothetical protein